MKWFREQGGELIVLVIIILSFSFLIWTIYSGFNASKQSLKFEVINNEAYLKVYPVDSNPGIIQVFSYDGNVFKLLDYSNGTYVENCNEILTEVSKNKRNQYKFDIKYYAVYK